MTKHYKKACLAILLNRLLSSYNSVAAAFVLQLGYCLFLRFLLQFLLAYTTPRHVHADGDAGVGTQRDELLAGLARR